MIFSFDPALDLFPMLAAGLASVACAVLGNFLVLRRQSLMGDAISHSVLPGLVAAFLLTSTVNTFAMLLGAAVAGVVTVVAVELVKKLGRVEPGAAMGVVFSVLFALGVLMIDAASEGDVHLDASCLLHGQLETLVWFDAPPTARGVLAWETLGHVPRQVWTLLGTASLALAFVVVAFKELRLASFDGEFSTAIGFASKRLHYALMIFVALATVASFEAVGSILVIAMLVCPAATARLMTDRLDVQIGLSIVFALAASVGGYVLANALPPLFGGEAVGAAGSMTVVSGVLMGGGIVLAPRRGVVARLRRRAAVRRDVAIDNVLAELYRAAESGRPVARVRGEPPGVRAATRRGLIESRSGVLSLTEDGEAAAASVVRRHRLWEQYLVEKAGIAPDHVHETAEQLEHLPSAPLSATRTDPHGKPIPDAATLDERSN